jgi:hypothetical protein
MADVDPELMALRAEYEQVVGKPAGSRNKNDIDMMRRKIEKVKNPKPKGKPGRQPLKPPKQGLDKAMSPRRAPEPATEYNTDGSQGEHPPDSLELAASDGSNESPAAGGKPPDAEENDEYYKELAAIAAQIDPKQFSLVMQLISRDVWAEGRFAYLPDCVEKALKILEAPDNVFHEDSWDDLDDQGRLRRWGEWFHDQPNFKDLSVQKQAAANLLGFNEEKWDYNESDDEDDDEDGDDY